MVVGTQSSPLVISEQGFGNDVFLYWVSDCHGTQNVSQLEFDFAKGTSVHEQSRADFCKLRFKKTLYTRLYALSSHMTPPGVIIYNSDDRKEVEYSNPIDYSALGREFIYRHPEYRDEYDRYNGNSPAYDYPDVVDSELISPYDDSRVQKALTDMTDDRPPISIATPLFQGDYPLDDRSDGPLYSAPYNLPNLGNQFYYLPPYYPRSPHHNSMYHITPRNSWPKEKLDWPARSPRVNSQFYERYPSSQSNNGRPMMQKRNVAKKSFPNVQSAMTSDLTRKRKVQVRHVGPHDGGGIQRVISTGTLAPTLKAKGKQGIDIVFATFWFYPSSVENLLPEDKRCIEDKMRQEGQRFKPSNPNFGMDHDAYEEMITKDCLKKSGRLKNEEIPNEYNPFNRPMGQLTLYRIHINCHCATNVTQRRRCSKILPFHQQGWPSYMGRFANSAAIPRN